MLGFTSFFWYELQFPSQELRLPASKAPLAHPGVSITLFDREMEQ